MNDEAVLGRDESSIVCCGDYSIHASVIEPLQNLQRDAERAGFRLQVASGYRSFDRQLLIWNDKVAGLRPVFDAQGVELDMSKLDCQQQVLAILQWSALPGGSRHHWGTDVDIYDAAAVAEDYQLQLSDKEVSNGGVFVAMHEWLDSRIATGKSHGFYRPYTGERGHIAAERWHLSYAPLSCEFQQRCSVDLLRACVEAESRLELREAVLDNFEYIFKQYVCAANGAD